MPIKLGQPRVVYISHVGSGKYMPLGYVTNIESELTNDEEGNPFIFTTKETLTFSAKFGLKTKDPRALYYFFVKGNDLYLRFPKKLRRKKE